MPSLAVTARLAAGESPLVEAALVKDLGTTLEQSIGALAEAALGDDAELAADAELYRTAAYVSQISPTYSLRGGTREIQRTMLELLNQLDGFDERGDVKVIMATNKIESLDPALIRPGRIDRKIEFPMPDAKTKRHIFGIHTARMTMAEDVDLEVFIMAKDELSGADIKAVCTEAGLLALRERRMKVMHMATATPSTLLQLSVHRFEQKADAKSSGTSAPNRMMNGSWTRKRWRRNSGGCSKRKSSPTLKMW